MLAELKQKSQVTIPKELVTRLGLSEGDLFEVTEQDGAICLVPVAVYPKRYIDELRSEIDQARARIAAGEQPVFDSVDEMFQRLDESGS